MKKQDIFPTAQKGCRKESYGCKDQLLINKMILENVKSKRNNLSTAWIDYLLMVLRCLEIFQCIPYDY